MLSRSEILIIKRFLFSKKTEGYVSIFSWFSIIGITLGVAAIIIVMSVMNGFRSNLTERLIGVNSHINLYSFDEKIKNHEIEIITKQMDSKSYKKIFSSIETQGLVISDNISKGVIMRSYKEISSEHYLYESIINLMPDDQNCTTMASDYYSNFMARNIDTLYDDRECSIGKKLSDNDLIGTPIQIIIGKRDISAGVVEIKDRQLDTSEKIQIDDVKKFFSKKLNF